MRADVDDVDDVEDGADAEGRAVVLCRVESLGVRFRFTTTLDEALALAAEDPCSVDGCLGGHMVVYRRDNGRLRIIADVDDGDDVRGRLSDALRVRERRRLLRARLGYAERQRRRRAANREALEREDHPDVDPG